MTEYERLKARARVLEKQYPIGTRVMLKSMNDVQAPPFGTLGTVQFVDAIGNIFVQWDSGSTLNVTDKDEVVIIGKGGVNK